MNKRNPIRRIVMVRILGLIGVMLGGAVLAIVNTRVNPYPSQPTESHQHEGEESASGTKAELSPEELQKVVGEYRDKVAVIKTSRGTIKFKFYPENAPRTVENFVNLAQKGFYNGSPFHRIVKDFVIQTGSPDGSPGGGPGYTIPAEFNQRSHVEGTVAMARANDPNSGGSQFYICVRPQPPLDGKYTVFGQVVEGMDVVKKIAEVETDQNDRPVKPIAIETVTIEQAPEVAAS